MAHGFGLAFPFRRGQPNYEGAIAAMFNGVAGDYWDVPTSFAIGQIWQDTARTTLATVNSVVGSILGRMGRFYAEQGTTANKPQLRGTPIGPDLLGGAGSFASSAGWTLTGGWSIAAGKAAIVPNAVAGFASYPASIISGHVYRFTVTIDSIAASNLRVRIDGTVDVDGAARTVAGSYVDYLTANQTGTLQVGVLGTTTSNATIDNLQIYDVTAGQVVAPYYLSGDGTDFLVTPGNVDFSASDEVTVVVGFRKYSDAAPGIVISNGYASDATYAMYAPSGGGMNNVAHFSRGTAASGATASSIVAPATRIAAARSKISTPINTLRINGVQAATAAGTQGTGNFGNLPIYLFRTAGGAIFVGDIYFAFAINRQLSDADTVIIERLAARATGVTL